MKVKVLTMILILLVILAVILYFAFDTSLKTVTYNIFTDKLHSNVRIAYISDLHSCEYGDGQSELISQIEKSKPDVVCYGGDIFDKSYSLENSVELLEKMVTKYPCYFVTGNHEFWNGNVKKTVSEIRSYGIKVLSGSCETINIRGEKINICGIDDKETEKYFPWSPGISDQLERFRYISNEKEYTILLAHHPEDIKEYLHYNFDLVLSGHAHGGQWRIPGIVNGIYAPNQGFFPKYAGGEYDFDNKKMIVSRGLEKRTGRLPRIFNRPELVIVNLK